MSETSEAEPAAEMPSALFDLDVLAGIEGSAGDDGRIFKIGTLAREFGVTVRSLRFYEDRGLISPARRGTTRLYSSEDRQWLRLLLLCKTLGFSLMEAEGVMALYRRPGHERDRMKLVLKRFVEQRLFLLDQLAQVEKSIEAMDISIKQLRSRRAALIAASG